MILIGITKTYKVIFKWYYRITFNNVSFIITRYTIYNSMAKAIKKPSIQPIISKGYLHRIIINLIDFRSNIDGPYY